MQQLVEHSIWPTEQVLLQSFDICNPPAEFVYDRVMSLIRPETVGKITAAQHCRLRHYVMNWQGRVAQPHHAVAKLQQSVSHEGLRR